MVGGTRPRRGSMGFYPRKRAKSIIARVRRWPKISEVKLLGFAAYKVGMAHMVMTEDYKYSPLYGKEVVKPVTILVNMGASSANSFQGLLEKLR